MLSQSTLHNSLYDLAICGGGLAGLTLARQVKQALPHSSILLLDRMSRPLPDAAFKVGESTVEVGAFYLADTLKLQGYLDRRHLHKLGLRFFFGEGTTPLQERPEFGLSAFPAVSSYQLDRGVLESDLRQMNAEDGIHLLEGMRVRDIQLGEDEQPHEILFTDPDEMSHTVQARWVADATGRRRLLQRKLGFTREVSPKHSSVWFRYEGRIDIDDLVPREHRTWHERVPEKIRYYSTNHLMGDGYWLWIIPLSSNYTSVGIVAQEDLHPFEHMNRYELAMQWLHEHEPVLASYLQDRVPVDFLRMRKYSYSSRQVFSPQRWACVGEAGVFADPFYSPGADIIGFGNTALTEMIKQDRAGTLTPKLVETYSQFLISYNDRLKDSIHQGYPFFNNPQVMTAKILWDITSTWCFVCPQMFNSIYLDPEKSQQIRRVTAGFFFLTRRVQRLFVEWAAKSPGQLTYDFLDYLTLDFLRDLRLRNLQPGKSMEELLADQHINMELVEELAQVIFLLAVEDVMPEYLEHFPPPTWVHAWRISLQPEQWEADGLLQPRSEPRDLSEMRTQIRSLFRVKTGVAVS